MIELLLARYEYVAAFLVLGIGLYLTVGDRNLVKKVIGLNVFQTAVFLFFIVTSLRVGGVEPLLTLAEGVGPYVNPLPHVIVLTAIVVGVSLKAAGLALVVRIHGEYGTLNEDVVEELIDDG